MGLNTIKSEILLTVPAVHLEADTGMSEIEGSGSLPALRQVKPSQIGQRYSLGSMARRNSQYYSFLTGSKFDRTRYQY